MIPQICNPSSVTAFSQLLPVNAASNSLLYICTPNKGKAAPKLDRAKLFAASAEAAYRGYCNEHVSNWPVVRLRRAYTVHEEGENARVDPDDTTLQDTGQQCSHLLTVAAFPQWKSIVSYPILKMAENINGTAGDQLFIISKCVVCFCTYPVHLQGQG